MPNQKIKLMFCFLCFSGKSWIYIFSNLYFGMRDENHSLRVLATSNSLFTECLEPSRLHHCHDRVGAALSPLCIISSGKMDFLFYSVISTILSTLQIEGFDVKALRAFRVLRPLRLVSGVPSELIFIKCASRTLNSPSILTKT